MSQLHNLKFKISYITTSAKFSFFVPTTTPPSFLLAFCLTMEHGCGVLYFVMWWVRLTASLIAPITSISRREEFHDDGNIPLRTNFHPTMYFNMVCSICIKWNSRFSYCPQYLASRTCETVPQHTANTPHDASRSRPAGYTIALFYG